MPGNFDAEAVRRTSVFVDNAVGLRMMTNERSWPILTFSRSLRRYILEIRMTS